jgi:hypothetical protein
MIRTPAAKVMTAHVPSSNKNPHWRAMTAATLSATPPIRLSAMYAELLVPRWPRLLPAYPERIITDPIVATSWAVMA